MKKLAFAIAMFVFAALATSMAAGALAIDTNQEINGDGRSTIPHRPTQIEGR